MTNTTAMQRLTGLSLILLLGACSTSDEDGQIEGAADGGVGTADAAPPSADAHPAAAMHAVYAHSSSTLYRLNADTLEVEVVGTFSGCSSVVDIALDKDSNLYGTTFTGLYKIDIVSAECTLISTGAYPNSLSFVPAGILDPAKEVLVAYTGSQYETIDVDTGLIKSLGSISGGYASSGDVVSVEGGGTYLTASGPDCNDCLLEIDPSSGGLIKNWGELGFSSVFGLAYWGGVAYGFDDTGAAFSIDFGATQVTTTPITIPGAPAGLSFWGAGSTTQAPIID